MRSAPFFAAWGTTPPFLVERFCWIHRSSECAIYARSGSPDKASWMNSHLLHTSVQPPCAGRDGPECESRGGKTDDGAVRSRTTSRQLPPPPTLKRCGTRQISSQSHPGISLLRLARSTIQLRVPRTLRTNRCAEKCRIILVPVFMVVKKICAGLEIARSSE